MAKKAEKVRLIKNICQFIEENEEFSSLNKLATHFNLSPTHLQKTFREVVGISPHQYADELRLKRLKKELKKGKKVTTAIYESGYSTSSNLYGRAARQLGMTPVSYGSGAVGINISFSVTHSPLGKLLVAKTKKGICALSMSNSIDELVAWLYEEFPKAIITQDDLNLKDSVIEILHYLKGEQPHCDLPLDIKATAFQRRVWEELRRIPYGTTRSYSQIARTLGHPSATRAVARACATNLVSLIIPCHRVVRKGGALGGYRWGLKRKEALLKLEKSQTDKQDK